MRTFKEIKKIIQAHKIEMIDKYHVSKIGIFGSYARNEQSKKSDLDILVDFKTPVGLFKQAGLWNYLDNITKMKTDMVCFKKIRPELKKNILHEVVYL